jgi:3-phosphoshikimate 1-carboxyvinyltransferase
MRERLVAHSMIRGTVKPPGDKSISHRALIFNGITDGKAIIENVSIGSDVNSTIRCIRKLGVKVEKSFDSNGELSISIRGSGSKILNEPTNILNAGNSGTTMRLLTGLMSSQSFFSVLTGDKSLRSRPMGRIIEPLNRMGANIIARDRNSRPPLVIIGGTLSGIDHFSKVASAQVKSAILIAGLFANGKTIVREPFQSRDHTERLLRAMGAVINSNQAIVSIEQSEISAVDIRVPGDVSAAAFWIVLAICHSNAEIKVNGVGINPTRTGILDTLKNMGANIIIENIREESGEPVADIIAKSSSLEGVTVEGAMIPRIIDEIPILALAACFANGETIIKDAKELRVKETDRINTLVSELTGLGAEIQELNDGLIINGKGHLNGSTCRSHGDHRLAMTLGIAGLLTEEETIVEGAEAAQVSYPHFWNDLRNLIKTHE